MTTLPSPQEVIHAQTQEIEFLRVNLHKEQARNKEAETIIQACNEALERADYQIKDMTAALKRLQDEGESWKK